MKKYFQEGPGGGPISYTWLFEEYHLVLFSTLTVNSIFSFDWYTYLYFDTLGNTPSKIIEIKAKLLIV